MLYASSALIIITFSARPSYRRSFNISGTSFTLVIAKPCLTSIIEFLHRMLMTADVDHITQLSLHVVRVEAILADVIIATNSTPILRAGFIAKVAIVALQRTLLQLVLMLCDLHQQRVLVHHDIAYRSSEHSFIIRIVAIWIKWIHIASMLCGAHSSFNFNVLILPCVLTFGMVERVFIAEQIKSLCFASFNDHGIRKLNNRNIIAVRRRWVQCPCPHRFPSVFYLTNRN
mmetsp:Transcript_28473/g.45205  ORF Transcript_28473/g.45205 Transcript_28473/m.45205 type:complete len:230 (-) Transcript_28473:372-1061(-)